MNRISVLKYSRSLFLLLILSGNCFYSFGQQKEYEAIDLRPFKSSAGHWYGIKDEGNVIDPLTDKPRYNETEITKIADNVLLFQRKNGGWPKNYDMQAILSKDQVNKMLHTKL